VPCQWMSLKTMQPGCVHNGRWQMADGRCGVGTFFEREKSLKSFESC
jgi:hypothetical protein